MKTENRGHQEIRFTQKRLTSFFVLVVGIAILMVLYLSIFFAVYLSRYQEANRQIPVFREYYEEIYSVNSSIDNYLINEEESDYELAEESLRNAEASILSLENSVRTAVLTREIQDVSQLTELLAITLEKINSSMEQYLADEIEFSEVSAKYEEFNDIYDAILDEYAILNEMILDYIEIVYQNMSSRIILAFSVLLIVLAVSGGLIYSQVRYIHHFFSEPISQMIQSAQMIQMERFEEAQIAVDEQNVDEGMALLIHVFNEMSYQVKQRIETLKENSRVQKLLQESRFQALQMQINPHFMFNTLNMIADYAYLEDAPQTILLINKTAKLLRFSLDFSGKTVTLPREVDELSNYVYIQEQRFGERIHFDYSLCTPIPDIAIPSLTLQPLVENAITHGVGMLTSGAQITIRIADNYKDKFCEISVQDNGKGMTESKLQDVLEDLHTSKEQIAKIGLRNVYMRLKLLWREQILMDIVSAPDKGTSIIIKIFYNKET